MGKSTALVTGAAGFLGSHVADHCLQQGMKVVVVDDLSCGFRKNVPRDATWVQGDLRDSAFVASLGERERFDYVYHLAAYAAEGLSHFIRHYNYDTNLLASIDAPELLAEVASGALDVNGVRAVNRRGEGIAA